VYTVEMKFGIKSLSTSVTS